MDTATLVVTLIITAVLSTGMVYETLRKVGRWQRDLDTETEKYMPDLPAGK